MNVEWISHLPAAVRRGLYFGLQRAIGSRIAPIWRQFQSWEHLAPDPLHAAIDQRLGTLLNRAVQHSEYYRDLQLPRHPGEPATSFLQRFPILSRSTVRQQFPRLVTDALRSEITGPQSVCRQRYGWLIVKTGGTTGMPTAVVHDAPTRDWGRATRLYAARLSGFPLGTPYFRLWGSEPDLLNTEAALHLRIQRHLHGEILLNAFRSKEQELRRHHAVLLAHPHIRHLMTYVDAAASLAHFIQDQNLPPTRLDSIQACAGTVTPAFRDLLESTWGAKVFNKYGSRECTDLACECHHHTGLHVFSPNAYLEVVDEHGQPSPPHQLGRILVTILNNHSFPMIRYDIGDVGSWAEPGPCPCGSPFPRLHSVEGRQDDLLVTQDGTLQSSVFFRHFVGVSLNRHLIREWQIEQTGRLDFVFRYLPLHHEGLPENLAALQNAFRRVLGHGIQLEMKEVQDIPPSPSGKVRWIINRYCPEPLARSTPPSPPPPDA